MASLIRGFVSQSPSVSCLVKGVFSVWFSIGDWYPSRLNWLILSRCRCPVPSVSLSPPDLSLHGRHELAGLGVVGLPAPAADSRAHTRRRAFSRAQNGRLDIQHIKTRPAWRTRFLHTPIATRAISAKTASSTSMPSAAEV